MSELSAVSGVENTSIYSPINEETSVNFDELINEGTQAIKTNDYDKAIQIIVKLDTNCSGKEEDLDKLSDLIISLVRTNLDEGKRLVSIPFKTFTLSLEDRSPDNRSLIFQTKDNYYKKSYSWFSLIQEGLNLIKSIPDITYGISQEVRDEIEKKIKDILKLSLEGKIICIDIADLFIELCFSNEAVAMTLLPLFEKAGYSIQIDKEGHYAALFGNQVLIKGDDPDFLFIDMDKGLEFIDSQKNPEDKGESYLTLARFHPEKRLEFINKAKEHCFATTAPLEKVALAFDIVDILNAYQLKPEDFLAEIKKSLKEGDETLVFKILSLAKKAISAMENNDKKTFDLHMSAAKELIAQVQDKELIENLQEEFEDLMDEGTEVFGSGDQLSLIGNKV